MCPEGGTTTGARTAVTKWIKRDTSQHHTGITYSSKEPKVNVFNKGLFLHVDEPAPPPLIFLSGKPELLSSLFY